MDVFNAHVLKVSLSPLRHLVMLLRNRIANKGPDELSELRGKLFGLFWIRLYRLDLPKLKIEWQLYNCYKKFQELGRKLEEADASFKVSKDKCDQLSSDRRYKESADYEGRPIGLGSRRLPPPVDEKELGKAKRLAKYLAKVSKTPQILDKLDALSSLREAREKGKKVTVMLYPGELSGQPVEIPEGIDFLISSDAIKKGLIEPAEEAKSGERRRGRIIDQYVEPK